MMRHDESRTDHGVIKIHKNVIASIAAIAASEIEGVKKVSKDSFSLASLLRNTHTNIKVDFDRDGEAKVEIPLIISYGFNIPEVASKVQENARAALERMTNLVIKDIDINIRGIEPNEPTTGGPS